MNKLPLPTLHSDEDAERFVDEADLSLYDLSGGKVMHLSPRPSPDFDVTTATLAKSDLELARKRAHEAGIPLDAYLGRLVHDSLERMAS